VPAAGGRGKLRLSTDYSAPSPVWSDLGCVGLGELGISPALARRLDAWNELFQDHFHWDGGWQDSAAREQFAAQAHQLVRDLERELDPVEVVLDDWTGAIARRT
jgi:hypothetical protein